MRFQKRFGRKACALALSVLVIGSVRAESGPFENFFRKLRHSFNEPQHKSTHHSSNKQTTSGTADSAEAGPTTPSEGSSTSSKNRTDVNAPPTERNTRTTTKASAKKGEDFPYGTPVPGKQGFVTSPFSPNSGYIDVRGFAPGTPVKDPYTGKVFLTP